MAKKYVQIPTAYLSGSGVVLGATSITINAFTDIYGNNLTMTDFGDSGYATLEPDTTNEESFTFTSITTNTNGTVTLGGIKTSLAKDPYTETSGLIRSHVGGSKVVVSDTAAFWATFANKNNDEALVGRWSTPVVPVNPNDIPNKAYVDATATGGATFNSEVVVGIAGENLTSGNIVYLLSTDSKWYKADSSIASKSVGVLLGVAQATVLSGASINVLLSGEDQKQSGLVANSTYYLSTAGGISTTKGANIRIVGRTKSGSATNFYVDFTNDPNVSLVDGSRTYAAGTGAANAYVVTLTPAITSADLKAGFLFSFKATNANTTASTVNINGIGAKTIKKLGGSTDLSSGDIAAGMIVNCEYDGTNVIMLNPVANSPAVGKFGGTGSDGALNVTSGTTSIDLGSAAFVVKNYTSINISVGATVNFINPATGGTVIHLKSQGAVTIAGTLDASGMGAAGGSGAGAGADGTAGSSVGTTLMLVTGGSTGGSGGTIASGAGGTTTTHPYFYIPATNTLSGRTGINLIPGSGGGQGRGGTNAGSAGGRGGGAVYIECAGAWNYTGAINVSGLNGSGGGTAAGGGGGGGAGMLCVLYGSLTANSGTTTNKGGDGGASGSGISGNTNGGGGGVCPLGTAGSGVTNAAGGAGATGGGGAGGGNGAGGAGATASALLTFIGSNAYFV